MNSLSIPEYLRIIMMDRYVIRDLVQHRERKNNSPLT